MKKKKDLYEDEISLENYHNKQTVLFKQEFENKLRQQTSEEEFFSEELQHIQKMALLGKLNPMHKQTLEEWKAVFPERFNNFCNQMNDENRQKLLHFLHLDDDKL